MISKEKRDNMAKTKVEKVSKTITGLELKYETILVYLISLVGFIFAFLKEEKVTEDARFHYKQSGAVFLVYLAISIVESILGTFTVAFMVTPLFIISVLFGIISGLLGLVTLAVFILSIIAIVKAFDNEKFEIPVVNKIANAIWK
jgi:uncharacterized membrane protein